MDEIYIPIKSDDGVDLKIGMSLDEADRMAKWIAAAVHKARHGWTPDEVGFVYWRRDTPDPMDLPNDEQLVSVIGKSCGYVVPDQVVDVPDGHGFSAAFEDHDYGEITAWAEMPAPTEIRRPMWTPEDEEEEE